MPSHTAPADEVSNQGERSHEFERELLDRYGPLIGGADLVHVAGFPNAAALRQALHRNKIGFPVFHVPGRRGRFAWAADVARWLSDLSRRQEVSPAEPVGRCDMP